MANRYSARLRDIVPVPQAPMGPLA